MDISSRETVIYNKVIQLTTAKESATCSNNIGFPLREINKAV